MQPNYLPFRFIVSAFLLFFFVSAQTQNGAALITEETRSLKTYPFQDPTRIPILTDNAKIYPYFTFEGYSHEGKPQDWNVVKLENDFVEVYVLPEVGGKVWGAIEKSTGQEFIYRNEVMKFRNIAMRGPWTSGGIEFNFGLIGHTPATATPVDYLIRENDDGSVSCIVGNLDLPSRTNWRVEIRLPKDGAYFDTRALWYNPTPMHQSYYNWMTGAAAAGKDLEFYCPGNQYIGHPGDAHPWPNEYGRKISEYSQNDFGGSKSYHVVGEFNDFFGGYFHDSEFGFGHWSRYDEMPGQKLWLWALSRSGGIWEDLLTDTDGQYIEFQAGRLFNQFSPSKAHSNPITQAVFPPYTTDEWTERWFPVKEIGGISDVSRKAAMHVWEEAGELHIAINGLVDCSGTLELRTGDQLLHRESVELTPMGVFSTQIELQGAEYYEVVVPEIGLHYYADPAQRTLDRPFATPEGAPVSAAQQHYKEGVELLEFRDYRGAWQHFEDCLALNAAHPGAFTGLAELSFRQGDYDRGVDFAHRALQLDTYHPGANYQAGVNHRAKGAFFKALDAFGWAARSMEFRSAAYAQMGEIYLQMNQMEDAAHYAERALDFNRFNTNALEVLAIVGRKTNAVEVASSMIGRLLEMDPLYHSARLEQYLMKKDAASREAFTGPIRNELAYQTYLEIAIAYYNRNLKSDALTVLDLSPPHPMISIWKAFIQKDGAGLNDLPQQSADFVFPYRRESIAALTWAAAQQPHWKSHYYLALNLWGKDRWKEAAFLMEGVGETPDYAPFYVARGELLNQFLDRDPEADLNRALELDPEDWRYYHRLIQYYSSKNDPDAAMELVATARDKFPENYTIGMDEAQVLLDNKHYAFAIESLKKLKVLPFEGASDGRRLYERAHLWQALEEIENGEYENAVTVLEASKEWPERLGVGQPYAVDERRQNYLLAYCYEQLGQSEQAATMRREVIRYTSDRATAGRLTDYLGLKLMTDPEASKMISEWEKTGIPSAALTWVIAKYQEDKNALASLEMAPENQGLFSGADFKMLEQIAVIQP